MIDAKTLSVVAGSELFDENWYLENYPHANDHEGGAASHYIELGVDERNDPGPSFSTHFYLRAHPDVREASVNPLYHFEMFGRKEGRQIHESMLRSEINRTLKAMGVELGEEPWLTDVEVLLRSELFDTNWYNEMFLANSVASKEAIEHYLKIGSLSGLDPSPGFSSSEYLKNNPDVQEAGINPLVHYERFGQFEERFMTPSKHTKPLKHKLSDDDGKQRKVSSEDFLEVRANTRKVIEKSVLFDENWYANKYMSKRSTNEPAHLHFVQRGAGLGFDPSPYFSTKWYFQQYPEVRRAGLNPLAHYILKGDAANFSPHPLFNVDWYVRTLEQGLPDGVTALEHYLDRPDQATADISPSFDAAWVAKSAAMLPEVHDSPLEAFYDTTSRRMDDQVRSNIIARGIRTPDRVEDFCDDGLVFEFENLTEKLKKDLVAAAQRSDAPLLSVIMPSWNRRASIVDAIRSAMGQTYKNLELIVVDDGSTDDTSDLVRKTFAKEIKAGRINLIEQANGGVCRARNTGLVAAKGDYVAYLDSDNTWKEQTASLLMAAMLRDENVMSVYGAVEIHADDLDEKPIMGRAFDRKKLLASNFIDLNAFAHRRALLEEYGGFDKRLSRLVDWELIMRYTADYEVTFLPIILVNYYLGDSLGNITRTVPMQSNVDQVISTHRVEYYRSGIQNGDQMARRYLKELEAPKVQTNTDHDALTPKPLRKAKWAMKIAIVLDEDVCEQFKSVLADGSYWFVADVFVKCAAGYKTWNPSTGKASPKTVPLASLDHSVFYWPTLPGRIVTAHTLHTTALAIAIGDLDVALISSYRAPTKQADQIAVQTIRDHLVVSKDQARHWLGHMELSGTVRGKIIEEEVERLGGRAQRTTLQALLGRPYEVAENRRFWSTGTRANAVSNKTFDLRTVPLPDANRPTVLLVGMKTAVGGVERLTVSLGEALKKDFHCIYLALEPVNVDQGDLSDQIRDAGLTLIDGSKIATPEERKELLSLIAGTYSPEAVYVMNGSSWFVENAADIRKIFADSVIVDQEVYDHELGWIEHYDKPSIRSFDSFIAVNSAIKERFLGELALPEDSVFHIPHGIDVNRGVEALETLTKQEARAEFNLPATGKIILFAGRLTDQKRPTDFLKLAESRRDNKGETYVLLGDGTLSQSCTKMIADLKLTNVVRIPFVKEINRIYRAIDVLTVVSEYEGLPLVLVEAVCMGIPVVSTVVGENRAVIEEFDAGICRAPAGDLTALSEDLDVILSQDTDSPRPGAARARDNFSQTRMAKRYARAGRLTFGEDAE